MTENREELVTRLYDEMSTWPPGVKTSEVFQELDAKRNEIGRLHPRFYHVCILRLPGAWQKVYSGWSAKTSCYCPKPYPTLSPIYDSLSR